MFGCGDKVEGGENGVQESIKLTLCLKRDSEDAWNHKMITISCEEIPVEARGSDIERAMHELGVAIYNELLRMESEAEKTKCLLDFFGGESKLDKSVVASNYQKTMEKLVPYKMLMR